MPLRASRAEPGEHQGAGAGPGLPPRGLQGREHRALGKVGLGWASAGTADVRTPITSTSQGLGEFVTEVTGSSLPPPPPPPPLSVTHTHRPPLTLPPSPLKSRSQLLTDAVWRRTLSPSAEAGLAGTASDAGQVHPEDPGAEQRGPPVTRAHSWEPGPDPRPGQPRRLGTHRTPSPVFSPRAQATGPRREEGRWPRCSLPTLSCRERFRTPPHAGPSGSSYCAPGKVVPARPSAAPCVTAGETEATS